MTNLPTIDIAGVLQRIGGDQDLLREIIDLFLETAPEQLRHLQTAVAGAYNSAETLRLVHDLKGTAANIGAEHLRHLARQYELAAQQGDESRVRENYALILDEFAKVCCALQCYCTTGGAGS